MSEALPDTEPASRSWTLWIIAALMLGGVVVGVSYMKRNQYEAVSPRPAYITKIERDVEATDQNGQAVRLSSMKGKVYLAVLFDPDSTPGDDPRPALLRTIGGEFAARDDFGVVAFSATPGEDSPEALAAFLERQDAADAGWIFLTGDPETLPAYLKRYFRLHTVTPGTAPGTTLRHDTRVVLVDRKANIRGYYRLLDPVHGADYLEALRRHLTHVLDNP